MTDFRCICEYKITRVRCPEIATQEDGLCDNCRTSEKCIAYRNIYNELFGEIMEGGGQNEEALGG